MLDAFVLGERRMNRMQASTCAEDCEPALVGGRYLIVKTLGEGGVAVVHRARDTATGRDVALKRLRETSGDRVWQTKFSPRTQS